MDTWQKCIVGVGLGLLFALSMWAYSAPGSYFTGSVLAFFLWLLAIAAWILWLVARAVTEKGLRVDWRMFAVPVLGAITVGLIYADGPLRARFLVSQPSMTNAAEFMIDHPSKADDRTRIGSYKAFSIDVSRKDETVSFQIPDTGFLNLIGFTYSRSGKLPRDFTSQSLTKMNDHWWVWTQDW